MIKILIRVPFCSCVRSESQGDKVEMDSKKAKGAIRLKKPKAVVDSETSLEVKVGSKPTDESISETKPETVDTLKPSSSEISETVTVTEKLDEGKPQSLIEVREKIVGISDIPVEVIPETKPLETKLMSKPELDDRVSLD